MDIRKNPPSTRATTTCSTDNTLELPLDLGNAEGGYYNLLLMGTQRCRKWDRSLMHVVARTDAIIWDVTSITSWTSTVQLGRG